jgi:hypothetical protein
MKVLLIESVPSGDPEVAEQLRARGHEPLRCFDHEDSPFPCVAVAAPERCPLAAGDVAVACVIREFGVFDPTPFESGVSCALRNRIPVVVEGANMTPFVGYAIDARGDLVSAVEEAATASQVGHVEAVREFLDAALVRFDIVPDDVDVDVRRVGPEVRVNVVLPEPSAPATEYLASRLAGVVRAFDPYVPRLDIVVSTR